MSSEDVEVWVLLELADSPPMAGVRVLHTLQRCVFLGAGESEQACSVAELHFPKG